MDTRIKDILSEVNQCESCKTIEGYSKFPLDSHGTTELKYMLVSEAPGKDSISQGKYWVGAGGRTLRSAARGLGTDLEDIFYLTDIVKCWPNVNGENRPLDESEISACSKFIDREIQCLEPAFILSLGVKSSENLPKQRIVLSADHGKLFKLNNTKVLVMYHPSSRDVSRRRDVYVRQLKGVISKLIERDLEGFEDVFSITQEERTRSDKEKDSKPQPFQDVSLKGISFTLPALGNSITASDVSNNQLRITADFKSYFPRSNTTLTFHHKGGKHSVRFTARGRRSHILKLGSNLVRILDLSEDCRVKITRLNSTEYSIEKP